jgi:hypothetical protein
MKHQNIKKTGGRVGIQLHTCRLGGAMVRVLVIRPKVWWFKPGRSDGFLRATKIRSTPLFGGGVKPGPPCRKILRHVKKIICKCEQKRFSRSNSTFPLHVLPACYKMTLLVRLPDSSGGRIRAFPSIDIILS